MNIEKKVKQLTAFCIVLFLISIGFFFLNYYFTKDTWKEIKEIRKDMNIRDSFAIVTDNMLVEMINYKLDVPHAKTDTAFNFSAERLKELMQNDTMTVVK